MACEKWVHYTSTDTPIALVTCAQRPYNGGGGNAGFKPRGLWITPEGVDDNWFEWCTGESFQVHGLRNVHDVVFKKNANLLRITTVEELDAFSMEYARDIFALRTPRPTYDFNGEMMSSYMLVDWQAVAAKYSGILISPYQWSRRLVTGDDLRAEWYYAWDCASGCIWDAGAIESLTPRPDQRWYFRRIWDDCVVIYQHYAQRVRWWRATRRWRKATSAIIQFTRRVKSWTANKS